MATFRIRQTINLLTDKTGSRLRLAVTECEDGVDPAVFVYQRRPSAPGSPVTDEYVHVASVTDMAAYPASAPGLDAPFFRLHYTDLVFQSDSLMLETLAVILEEVRGLMETKKALDTQGSSSDVDITY